MTPEDKKRAAVAILKAVYETIQEAGPMGAPAGHLYAALMSRGCTLEQYQTIENNLLRSGLVTKHGDCLFVKDAQ
jgi:hypothetical protein